MTPDVKQSGLVAQANEYLQIPVPEFALMSRDDTVHLVMQDAELLDYIDSVSDNDDGSRNEFLERARLYAARMGPRFSALFYFRIGRFLARTLIRLHYRVRVVAVDPDAMAKVSPDATVILVGNHRSNFDPLLLPYLASERSTVSLSAGEWARIWPFRQLVRAAGGFVLDRDADDPLYRQVLASYVRITAERGIHHGFFPEGELTRSGRMGPPKLGFLSFFCRACSEDRDIVFIPVSINYDRTPEDRKLSYAESGFDRPGILFLIASSLRYIASVMSLVVTRSRPFGYACVAFSKPVSLQQWLSERGVGIEEPAMVKRHAWLPDFAQTLMESCAAAVPATPAVLVASVMVRAAPGKEWTLPSLVAAVCELAQLLRSHGAHVYLPGEQGDAVESALRILTRNKLVRRDSEVYTIIDSDLPVLRYYANSIEHLTS